MTQCFFCRRKVGATRKKGKLDYEVIYTRNPELGYITCVDCLAAIDKSIQQIRSSGGKD